MKKILLIFILLLNPFIALAEINECKTDVYFANGILTEEDDAEYNALEILKPAIIDLLGQEPFTQKIGKVDYAYNNTIGFWSDGIETVLQKFGWMGLRDSLGDVHASDVQTQITAYKQSIKDGHKVLAVAHSQGNLFTYEALRGLDPWMQEYFKTVGLTTPSDKTIPHSHYLTFDNDPIHQLNGAGSVVVKDTCKPFEHFHIRSEATIYPGTFGVSIIPKNTNIIKIKQTLT
jgi:hypothetical protein